MSFFLKALHITKITNSQFHKFNQKSKLTHRVPHAPSIVPVYFQPPLRFLPTRLLGKAASFFSPVPKSSKAPLIRGTQRRIQLSRTDRGSFMQTSTIVAQVGVFRYLLLKLWKLFSTSTKPPAFGPSATIYHPLYDRGFRGGAAGQPGPKAFTGLRPSVWLGSGNSIRDVFII